MKRKKKIPNGIYTVKDWSAAWVFDTFKFKTLNMFKGTGNEIFCDFYYFNI